MRSCCVAGNDQQQIGVAAADLLAGVGDGIEPLSALLQWRNRAQLQPQAYLVCCLAGASGQYYAVQCVGGQAAAQ